MHVSLHTLLDTASPHPSQHAGFETIFFLQLPVSKLKPGVGQSTACQAVVLGTLFEVLWGLCPCKWYSLLDACCAAVQFAPGSVK